MNSFSTRFSCIMICLMLTLPSCLTAQVISGKVTDSSKSPIVDASIYEISGRVHAHSNSLGLYKCHDLAVGDTIEVRFLGFRS